MNKKLYTLAIAALVGAASANAQSIQVLSKDATGTQPFEWEDWSGPGLTIAGATLTMSEFCLNTCGLPFSSGESITLSNGGKVKFFDNPDVAYPLSAEYPDYADYMKKDGKDVEEIPFNWVIDGDGNEIYLDSYCTMGGTITGSGSVTIYVTDNTTLKFACGKKDDSGFTGTIILKSLPGYTCSNLKFAAGFEIGKVGGLLAAAEYAATTTVLDITNLSSPKLDFSALGTKARIPAIKGKGTIVVPKTPHLAGISNVVWHDPEITAIPLEVDVEGGSAATDAATEIYSTVWMKGQERTEGNQVYVRHEGALIVDSKEPCFVNHTGPVSLRGAGSEKTALLCGNGWIANGVDNNTNGVVLSAGHPSDNAALDWNRIGSLTISKVTTRQNNILRVDMAGKNVDVINVTDVYTMFEGANTISLGLNEDFFLSAVAGNYKVINGNIDAAMMAYNDTIGYEVWDNNGCAYVVRSVKGGEKVVSAVTGEEFIAQPGDSIGSATFGQLESKYGATCMDVNRPHYVVVNWGPGSFSNGMSTDEKNFEDPALYTPNANKQDYQQWLDTWEKFKAEHPVSSSHEAVGPEDKSVIPGTVNDSIFVTYSTYFTADGEMGGHDWSWKNGSGYAVSANSDRGAAITYSYYYYSNNTVKINQSGKFLNAAGEEVPYAWNVSFPRTSKPVLDAEGNPVLNEDGSAQTVEIAAADQYKTDEVVFVNADGSSVNYWFDFKNFLTDGVITLGSKKVAADGKVSDVQDASADPSKTINDPTSIETMLKENVVPKSRSIFTLDGKQLKSCVKGLNIVITEYTDGSVDTKKVFVAE